jgi:hypothetical protein
MPEFRLQRRRVRAERTQENVSLGALGRQLRHALRG